MESLLYIDSPFTTGHYRGQHPRLTVADPASRAQHLHALAAAVGGLDPDARFAAVRVGGTASVLSGDGLSRLLADVRRTHCDDGAEITLTAAPDTVTSPYLSAAAASGYTRMEVPILTLSDRLLRQTGADWSAETIEDALLMLSDYACPNVSVVLWCGLPEQTQGQLRDALFTCAAVPGVRHIRLLQPDGVNEAQYRFCAEWLSGVGFAQYAPGRFARDGGEDRYYLLRAAGAKVVEISAKSV